MNKPVLLSKTENKNLTKVFSECFKKNIKGIVFLFIVTFIANYTAFSQSDNSIQIEKCVRLQSGLIMQMPNGEFFKEINPGISFQYCYGVKTAKNIGVGIGAGFQFFENESYIPVVLDLVYFIGKNKNCSFLSLDGGYSLGWSKGFKEYDNSSFKGGLTLGASLGKKLCTFEQLALFLNAGYKYQSAKLKYEIEPDQMKNSKLHCHMLFVSLGIMLEQ